MFYINKGRRCSQTAIKSLVDTEDNLSWNFLDELTGRENNQITTPVQVAYGLSNLNANFIYPVKPFFNKFSLKILKEKILSEFGKDIFSKINFEFIHKSINHLISNNLFLLEENINLSYIKKLIKDGRKPLCLINYDLFVDRKDKKNGHYIIINEIKENYSWISDCGPANAHPNKKISTKRLEKFLMETPLDYGVLFV